MTYNVHRCLGMDGKLSSARIARVIAQYAPDIVALQELDVFRSRSSNEDQARLIAEHLEMDFHFHPAIHLEEERYGDAILTHYPMELIHAELLPGLEGSPHLEPRGGLWVRIDVNGEPFNVINTHLGLRSTERRNQVDALLGAQWLGHPQCNGRVILCGDFNLLPSSKTFKQLTKVLVDSQEAVINQQPVSTFSSRVPVARIDHILIDSSAHVVATSVPSTALTRVASDHLPLIVDIRTAIPAPPLHHPCHESHNTIQHRDCGAS
jgi:endonuclease/exonuclease/phosphatase family metal-dependent hydrolase